MLRLVERYAHWLALGLIVLFFGRLLVTAAVKSSTFDEPIHIFQGALYWQHDELRPLTYNPPLVNASIGLPVSLVLHPDLPLDDPLWPTEYWLEMSQAFFWNANANGLQILWVGRVAVMLLLALAAAIVYRWAGQLWHHRLAGLLALIVFTFDPNILAHSGLATTDAGSTFYIVVAAYLVWRYWQQVGNREPHTSQNRSAGVASSDLPETKATASSTIWSKLLYVAAGVALGAAFAAKLSGFILLPALVVMVGYRLFVSDEGHWQRPQRRDWWRFVEIGGWLLIAAVVFLIAYRFEWTAMARDFREQSTHYSAGHSSFLLGEVSREGWWFYFPVLIGIKTPLPTLLLILLGLIAYLWRRRFAWETVWPLLIAGGILAAGINSSVNLGYRYLLPMLPLLAVFLGQLATDAAWMVFGVRGRRFVAGLVGLAVIGLMGVSLWVHPDYLAYFNVVGGGMENGWRNVADSNIDWGQDVQALADFSAENNIDHMTTALFGGDPLPYGVPATQLPVWPIGKPGTLDYLAFYPPRPAAGWYAISVTNWHGVYHDDPTYLDYFRQHEPTERVGQSIFVYDVAPDGPLTGVVLAGLGIVDVDSADYDATIATNNIVLRWADTRAAFLWPDTMVNWAVIGNGHQPQNPLLVQFYHEPVASGVTVRDDGQRIGYDLVTWDANPLDTVEWQSAEALFRDPATGDVILQLGGFIDNDADLLTRWQVVTPPSGELRLFVHVLDADGAIIAQHDGLDLRVSALQTGDQFAQLHPLALDNLPPGTYDVRVGVYDPATGVRLQLRTGEDSVILQTLTYGDSD
ncbi:MAG: phospholipid carrier-dependent glycosyltransferase [Anaerolineae bacterium]|nr:phospholipid carrier-dependent glycosyltransferase [Anaerolineae bacterium]